MGVSAVWDAIKPGFDRRVPFPILVSHFYKDHGRPIRLAIDAYQWIFECRVVVGANRHDVSREQIGRVAQNFFTKLKYLISYNVSFVLVFDGKLKPAFKRDKHKMNSSRQIQETMDFDEEYERLLRIVRDGDYREHDSPDIAFIKEMLRIWKITYVEAPAEGEAEAAKLQRENIVDFVATNDSDVLIYGATSVLRNLSKFKADRPASATAGTTDTQTADWWCTPVHIAEVEKKTGFDTKRLMLFSILCGADYNAGVTSLGPVKSSQIVLSGTGHIKAHIATFDYDDLPDFAEEFHNIYMKGLRTIERQSALEEFKKNVLNFVSENQIVFFKKRLQIKMDGFPPDSIIMIYQKPLYAEVTYCFDYKDTNFAEFEEGQSYIKDVDLDALFKHLISVPMPSTKNEGSWFSEKITEAYLLKSIILDSTHFQPELEKITNRNKNEKHDDAINADSWPFDYYSTRYQIVFNFKKPQSVLSPGSPPTSPRKKKGELFWMPVPLVPRTSRAYQNYVALAEYRIDSSPRKKKTLSGPKPQLNTLGSYIPSLSPQKTSTWNPVLSNTSKILADTVSSSSVSTDKLSKSSSTINKFQPKRKFKTKTKTNTGISPTKQNDILASLQNSPRKKSTPFKSLPFEAYSSSSNEPTPLESPLSNPNESPEGSRIFKNDGFDDSPIQIDTTLETIQSIRTEVEKNEEGIRSVIEISSEDDDEMMDISNPRRRLDFSTVENEMDGNDAVLFKGASEDVLTGLYDVESPFVSNRAIESLSSIVNKEKERVVLKPFDLGQPSPFRARNDKTKDVSDSEQHNKSEEQRIEEAIQRSPYKAILNRRITLDKSPFKKNSSKKTEDTEESPTKNRIKDISVEDERITSIKPMSSSPTRQRTASLIKELTASSPNKDVMEGISFSDFSDDERTPPVEKTTSIEKFVPQGVIDTAAKPDGYFLPLLRFRKNGNIEQDGANGPSKQPSKPQSPRKFIRPEAPPVLHRGKDRPSLAKQPSATICLDSDSEEDEFHDALGDKILDSQPVKEIASMKRKESDIFNEFAFDDSLDELFSSGKLEV